MVALVTAFTAALLAAQPTAIRHVSVVNILNGRIRKDVTVLVAGGTITAIGKSVHIGSAQVADGSGKFLIPGLWDMHVHCCNAPDHFFPLFLANGVTGIRDMADPLDELKTCRSNVESGIVLGPRMVFSGMIVDGPKPCWPGISIAVSTPEEGRRAVETVQHGGADFVKIYSLLPRDAYFAVAEEANKRHMVFAGHVPNAVTAEEASNAGQKSLEHLINVLEGCSTNQSQILADHGSIPWAKHMQAMVDSYDPAKAGALLACFRRNRTWQCPTLTMLNALVHPDQPVVRTDARLAYLPGDLIAFWNSKNSFSTKAVTGEDLENGRLVFDKLCELVGDMASSGVGILAGTDTPNPGVFPGFGIHAELALMVRSMTPLQALQAATISPARYFGWEKTLGTVQVGKAADLVLLEGNPLEDIRNTTRIAAVFVRGRYLNRHDLDEMLAPKPRAGRPDTSSRP